MGQQVPCSRPYVENNKLIITFFPKPDFRGFFIFTYYIYIYIYIYMYNINLLEFIPHHITSLHVF